MNGVLPGTTIEIKAATPNIARELMDNIFLSGGLVLSQVTRMTGLAPYEVQNWVKRGFLAPPVHKLYSRNQFCRIVTINMLRESMQIETITKLLSFINGSLTDESDDIVNDSDLYNYFVNLLAMMSGHFPDEDEIKTHIRYITDEFNEPRPGGRKRLALVLEIMLFTHYSANMRRHADELVQQLD